MDKYTAFFCEENIWHLVNDMEEDDQKKCAILFITNEFKTCALLNQKVAGEDPYVIWDYHVILHMLEENTIFDYDTKLANKNTITNYFVNTFGNQNSIPASYRSLIIPIIGNEYIKQFSSDRSHMYDQNNNKIQAFPEWPVIYNNGWLSLQKLINLDIEVKDKYKVYSTDEYLDMHQ